MPESRSPLARLVLFMICLAGAGSVVAGAHYFVVDQPQQNALAEYTRCTGGCVSTNVMYVTPDGRTRNPTDEACQKKCRDMYLRT